MIPEKIGKYTVIELLGRGGMGEVYLGEDPYIGRRVAIKMIKGADPDARDRFLHEARVIGGLAHPAIVSLIDFDFSGDEPFLVMELLKGQGLDKWIRQAHTLREKLVILEDVCQALAFAHENGVLHRDVKPSNVQVLPNGHAKLMDFGIARGGAARLTATGAVMGTPEYMAPEILRDASYSAKSDLYACSVLLYEMFTGENPFAAKTVAATLTNVLTHTPKDLGSVRADIPEALSAAVMRCLEKEPEARPEGFEELLGAGRAALAAPVPTLAETRAIPLARTAGGSLGETRAVPGQTSTAPGDGFGRFWWWRQPLRAGGLFAPRPRPPTAPSRRPRQHPHRVRPRSSSPRP
jgi:serine/threonine protein kinase